MFELILFSLVILYLLFSSWNWDTKDVLYFLLLKATPFFLSIGMLFVLAKDMGWVINV